MHPEDRLAELGYPLPAPPKPVGTYVPAARTGNLLYVSGQGPARDGRLLWTGKVGGEVGLEEGQEAARVACLNGLAAVKAAIGDLDTLVRVVRLGVFVASAPGFTGQPQVANGASELLNSVLGDRGAHARAAIGVAELPGGMPVEIDFIFEVR